MDLIVAGLGNPGSDYTRTRHNIGFQVVEALASRLNSSKWGKRGQGLEATAQLAGNTIHLLKPLTYMNLSGVAISDMIRRFILDSGALIVVHDDMDLPYGSLRIKRTGGHGGHNGIRSIIDNLETRDFTRVRVGVGRPPEGMAVPDYVLSDFDEEETASLPGLIDRAAKALCTIIEEGPERAMNFFHTYP